MRSLFYLFTFCLATQAWTDAVAQTDLNVAVLTTPISPTYTGTPDEWRITVSNAGPDAAFFSLGETVLELNLPAGIKINAAVVTNSSGVTERPVCAIVGQSISCNVVNGLELEAAGSLEFAVPFEFIVAGDYDLLARGGTCLADPDNVLAESNESNNDCTVALGSVVVRALPDDLNEDWLQVNQWSNLVRRYNSGTNTVSRAEIGLGPDDEPFHALNEIVRHPQTGDLYVFQRPYQTTVFGLGIYEPGNGVTPVGDTGLSLYDAAFSGDGTLYVLGRDGKLYTIDPATALPTQRCVTKFSSGALGSGNGKHGALAWDANEGLVAVGDNQLVFIDSAAFPPDPESDCTSRDVDIGLRPGSIYAAEVVDNRLYVMDRSSGLTYIAWDGVGGLIAAATHDAHGLIAFEQELPAPTVTCPAEVYVAVTMPFFTSSTSLFAVDLATGRLDFIRELPFIDVQSMEFDPQTGDLLVADASGLVSLNQISPCDAADPGEILVSLALAGQTQPLFALDLTQDDTLHVLRSTESLERLNRVTGAATKLGDLQKSSNAMVIYNREVIVADWDVAQDLSTGLAFYDLADVAAGPVRTVPLTYGAGLDAGQIREIESLDVGPAGEPLIGILARTRRSSSSNTSEALPNALVTITLDGVVEHLADLPNSAIHIATAYPVTVLSDGFEGDE